MGYAGRNSDPKTIHFAEMNAFEGFVLQNQQVKAAAQNHQLIRLIAMAIEIRMETWLNFSNQSFIAKQRIAEESNPRLVAGTLKNFDGFAVPHWLLFHCPNHANISCPGDVILATNCLDCVQWMMNASIDELALPLRS